MSDASGTVADTTDPETDAGSGPDTDADTDPEPAPVPEAVAVLEDAYRLVADLFVYPEEVDRTELHRHGRETVIPTVASTVDEAVSTDEPVADHLTAFLEAYREITPEEYVETHELDPTCPLYVGHYAFEEPETCRDIADADRNQYMVELNAIYEHFGFEIGAELPDFVPAMVEFLLLTLPDRDDPVRAEFLAKLHGMLPEIRGQFEDAGTPYWRLLAALQGLLAYDIAYATTVAVDRDAGRIPPGVRGDEEMPSIETLPAADDESGGEP
jgi:nitrate reductase assembly molybdenum cofactor insertion protein NarJ